MKEKIKRTEEALYNYKRMDIIIKNIQIDIENLLNDITLKAVSYDQISSKTNSFNSSVENEVIKREEYIKEQVDMLLNVKLFDGSFLTLFNAKDASSHHNI